MPCYKPLIGLIKPGVNGSKGQVKIIGSRLASNAEVAKYGAPTPLPCGQCVGCRLERSRQWAIRIMKELKLHDRSCFLTLTYRDESLHLTKNGLPTLVLEDIQLFMKRLRFRFSPHPLRFFQCGEYGDEKERPHHHLILFGEDFSRDRFPVEPSRAGFPQWESPTLSGLWGSRTSGLGRAVISEASFEAAAYVARYCVKKVTGKGSKFHYQGRKPEFVTMSRRPGIGSGYFDEFKDNIYPNDEVVPDIGRPASLPPRYFDRLLEKVDPKLYQEVKKKRVEGLDFWTDQDSTDSRLSVRERVKQYLVKNTLKRGVE